MQQHSAEGYSFPEDRILEQLTNALEKKDENEIRTLFSDNTRKNVEAFDEQITQLCDFYAGEKRTVEDGGTATNMSKQGSFRWEEVTVSFDITTTAGVYRLAIRFCATDTEDEGNVGITSLYITRGENSDMEFSYRGGHEWIPGIVIQENE